MYSTGYSGQILMNIQFSPRIFEIYSDIIFHEFPSGGSGVVPCGQTDRQTKFIVAFLNFETAPKIYGSHIFAA